MTHSFDRVVVLVNLDANHGRAENKWIKIYNEVYRLLPGPIHIMTHRSDFDVISYLKPIVNFDEKTLLISAGGDGTAHHLINKILAWSQGNISWLTLGFIGLGSSNDIIKPFQTFIMDVPVAMNAHKDMMVDLGYVKFQSISGEIEERCFLANASLGVIAEGNHMFNHPDFLLSFLKKRFVAAAIQFTSIKAILKAKNQPLILEFGEHRIESLFGFLSVAKIPFISGNLRIDQEIKRDDGRLGLNYCGKMNKRDLLKLLFDLGHGQFGNRADRHSYFVESLNVESKGYLQLEMDGEVFQAKDIQFGILPRKLNILT